MVSESPSELSDGRHAVIHVAAIEQFILRGVSGTSMAHIAEAAGMSRPALYQYFSNKADIFASAFVAVFEEHAERAMAALTQSGSTADRLDGFLQRFEGDMWQLLVGSPHSEEILRAKNTQVAESIGVVIQRLWRLVEGVLVEMCPGRSRAVAVQRAEWMEVLRYSPRGLSFDRPPIDSYRRRLATLARGLGADIDAAQ